MLSIIAVLLLSGLVVSIAICLRKRDDQNPVRSVEELESHKTPTPSGNTFNPDNIFKPTDYDNEVTGRATALPLNNNIITHPDQNQAKNLNAIDNIMFGV